MRLHNRGGLAQLGADRRSVDPRTQRREASPGSQSRGRERLRDLRRSGWLLNLGRIILPKSPAPPQAPLPLIAPLGPRNTAAGSPGADTGPPFPLADLRASPPGRVARGNLHSQGRRKRGSRARGGGGLGCAQARAGRARETGRERPRRSPRPAGTPVEAGHQGTRVRPYAAGAGRADGRQTPGREPSQALCFQVRAGTGPCLFGGNSLLEN